jgi:mannosyl-oligosaccharide alpha-1,2-mannosidase
VPNTTSTNNRREVPEGLAADVKSPTKPSPPGASTSAYSSKVSANDRYYSEDDRLVFERDAASSCNIPSAQLEFYKKNGFYFRDTSYDLRPEVIESYYYAYRVTGDRKYQDWAWEAIKAINATTRIGVGFTAVTDVNAIGGGNVYDNQESFWFAEVLKYSYLIFSKDGPWQVNHGGEGDEEEFVFNTEAHPFKVAGKNGGKPAKRVVTA